MNTRLRMEFLEALASQFIRCKRILVSNSAMARAMRAVKDRNSFDKIHVHEEMLADSVRMSAYRAAIQRYVNSQDHVVDIGTGTGVLAFLAAAKNPRKLYALDHSKKMIKYAKAVAEVNGIANVTFIASSSYKFRPAEPIDVLIQEQMGYALFEEGMLEVILDVRDRCLKPGGRILPAKFEFYLEPVQLLEQERIPLIQEQRLYGLTFPRARPGPNSGYHFRHIDPEHVAFMLCDPEPVFTFDLTTLTLDQIPKRFCVSKPIIRTGQVDGICMYFRAIFDDDISLSTGPEAAKTHWWMILYRTPARIYRAGEIFGMQVEVPELSEHRGWSWQIDMPRSGGLRDETEVVGCSQERRRFDEGYSASRERTVEALNMDRVMEGWEDYIDFVERPHEKFGGLPVCPFAKQSRLRGEYEFRVLELTPEAVLALAPLFGDTGLHLIICVDPRVDGITAIEARELVRELNAKLLDMNLMVTSTHPDDDFNIEGLYTRRTPHPAISLMRFDIGERAYKSLLKSHYYDKWTDHDFLVGFPGLEHLP